MEFPAPQGDHLRGQKKISVFFFILRTLVVILILDMGMAGRRMRFTHFGLIIFFFSFERNGSIGDIGGN